MGYLKDIFDRKSLHIKELLCVRCGSTWPAIFGAGCRGGLLRSVPPGQRFAFLVAKAGHHMIIDEARCLHVRVHDGAANKLEATLFHILAHRIGFG